MDLGFILKPFYKSRKFWYTAISIVLVAILKPLGFDDEQIKLVVNLCVALIVGQGLADAWKGFVPLIPKLIEILLPLLAKGEEEKKRAPEA